MFLPKMRLHKATGQACVVLDGKTVYLGRYDLPTTKQRYEQVIAEYLGAGRRLPVPADGLTVEELLARFLVWAQSYYVPEPGKPAYEVEKYKRAMRPLRRLYGHVLAEKFGPLALQTVRQAMVDSKWCRQNINSMVNRIKAIFRWGVSQELLPAGVYQALSTVRGLSFGRSAAKEGRHVRPVPIEVVEATKQHLSAQVASLVDLQLLTGARPGELCELRKCDLDRSAAVWTYTPERHKTARLGKTRIIYFGPKAQEVLAPFLLRADDAYLFSPAEADRDRRRKLSESRKTYLSCGNWPGTNRKERPETKPGDHYTPKTYAKAVARACERAFPLPENLGPALKPNGRRETHAQWRARLSDAQKKEIQTWRRDHAWHPYQLRHTAATLIRHQFGLEAAQLALGHSSALITDAVYAERDMQKIVEVVRKIG